MAENIIATRPPTAFLSSVTYPTSDSKDQPLPIRRAIYELGQTLGTPVWVAEIDEHDMKPPFWDPLDIADTCLSRVAESDVFILLLHGRFGSKVAFGATTTRSSFVEIELFKALLLQKPIFVLKAKEFDPDAELSALLEIFSDLLPDIRAGDRLSDKEILHRVERILGATKHKFMSGISIPFLGFPSTAERAVGNSALQRSGANLLFLNGKFGTSACAPVTRKPDKEFIASILTMGGSEGDQNKKLARLWLAARELEAAPFTESANQAFLPLWHDMLGQWSSASAWYGLHGHWYLGMAASLHSQMQVSEAPQATVLPRPLGPLASAYYSMAKRMPTATQKAEHFRIALSYVERAIGETEVPSSGNLGLRGSIRLAMGDRTGAIKDYEAQCASLETEGANKSRIGEALSELGFGELRQGWLSSVQRRAAVARLAEGVELMELDDTPARRGFLIRGKKKLALGLVAVLRLDEAQAQLEAAEALADASGMYDQKAGIPKILAALRLMGQAGRLARFSGRKR